MPRESLRLVEMSDREFLLAMRDIADPDGWVDSLEMATRLDLAERKIASSRLSWLKRYGVVEREIEADQYGNRRYRRDGKPVYTQRWKLTPDGEAFAMGHLRATQQRALDGVKGGAELDVARWLWQRARGGNPATYHLLRREWRYGLEHRNGSS